MLPEIEVALVEYTEQEHNRKNNIDVGRLVGQGRINLNYITLCTYLSTTYLSYSSSDTYSYAPLQVHERRRC